MRSHFMSRMKIEATVNSNFIIVSEANCSYPTNTFIVNSKLKSDKELRFKFILYILSLIA